MTAAASQPLARRVLWRLDIAMPLAIVAVWALLWLATLPLGDFPLNDDWTYARPIQTLLDTGRIVLLPWSAVNAYAQIYWGALFCKLFGFSYQTLRLSTAILGALGLVSIYTLLRELRATVAAAALVTLAIGCHPLYLSQSVTFMTDVPFAALVSLSMLLYAKSLRPDRKLLRVAAYAVGLVDVLIRQFAIVLPVAFAASVIRRKRLSIGLLFALAGSVLLFLALHLGYQKWAVATHRTTGFESQLSGFFHLDTAAALQRWREAALPSLGLLGMGLFPIAIVDPARFWRGGRRAALIWRALTLALALALLAIFYWRREIPPLSGNIVTLFGIGPLTLFDTYFLKHHLPTVPGQPWFWWGLSVGISWGAAVGIMATLSLAREQLRRPRLGTPEQGHAAMVLGFIASYVAALVAFLALSPLFDRYWIPLLLPFAAVLTMAHRGERPRIGTIASIVLIACMATFSVLGTHDWVAWHRSRWEAVGFLQARGIPATKIDGGYEFNGVTTYRPGPADQTGKTGWWVVDNEYALAGGPLEGYHEIASYPVHAWMWQDGERIAVLQRD